MRFGAFCRWRSVDGGLDFANGRSRFAGGLGVKCRRG
jgi:hypothetical protein